MKDEFSAIMIPDDQLIGHYLGKYALCQQKFNFLSGHKIILKMIVEHCAETLRIVSSFTTTTSSSIQQEQEGSATESVCGCVQMH